MGIGFSGGLRINFRIHRPRDSGAEEACEIFASLPTHDFKSHSYAVTSIHNHTSLPGEHTEDHAKLMLCSGLSELEVLRYCNTNVLPYCNTNLDKQPSRRPRPQTLCENRLS